MGEVTIAKNRVPALTDALKKVVQGANRDTARAIADAADAAAPRRTGSLAASFYAAVKGDPEGYQAAVADARRLNPKVTVNPPVSVEGETDAAAGAAAGHDYYIETGSKGRAPRPLMLPAAESERQKHRERVKKALREAGKKAR